jgi:Predicted permease
MGSKIRNPKALMWGFGNEPARREAFLNTARQNVLFLGKWLLLAFTLESLMVAYVPGDLIARIAGDGSLLSIASATLVGVPSYLNGTAALPLAAGLIKKGMAPERPWRSSWAAASHPFPPRLRCGPSRSEKSSPPTWVWPALVRCFRVWLIRWSRAEREKDDCGAARHGGDATPGLAGKS